MHVEGRTGKAWTPANYDGRSHGQVPLYEALARSYNQATVRIGLDIGVDEVADYLHRLGVQRRIDVYPAMMLGAFELTPLEVVQMYHTLASGGFRVPLRSIREGDGRKGAKALALRGRGISRGGSRAQLPHGQRARVGDARGHRPISLPAPARGLRQRGEDRNHRRSAGQLVRGVRQRSPRGGLAGSRRQLSRRIDGVRRARLRSGRSSCAASIRCRSSCCLHRGSNGTGSTCRRDSAPHPAAPDARRFPFITGSEPSPGRCTTRAALNARATS